MTEPTNSDVLVTLARLEGKVDAALAALVVRTDHAHDRIEDHETRLRAIESLPATDPAIDDHEARLRAIEAAPKGITARQFWSATATLAGLLIAALGVLATILV